MRKLLIIALLITCVLVNTGIIFAGSGPAPNSGDGVSDGSGLDSPTGPNSAGPGGSDNGPAGAAPNSGDGVNDGSGMDSPNSVKN